MPGYSGVSGPRQRTQFPLFSDLPAELRQMIWHHTASADQSVCRPDQALILEILECAGPATNPTQRQTHILRNQLDERLAQRCSLSKVSFEARQEARRYFYGHPPRLAVDFKRTGLHINLRAVIKYWRSRFPGGSMLFDEVPSFALFKNEAKLNLAINIDAPENKRGYIIQDLIRFSSPKDFYDVLGRVVGNGFHKIEFYFAADGQAIDRLLYMQEKGRLISNHEVNNFINLGSRSVFIRPSQPRRREIWTSVYGLYRSLHVKNPDPHSPSSQGYTGSMTTFELETIEGFGAASLGLPQLIQINLPNTRPDAEVQYAPVLVVNADNVELPQLLREFWPRLNGTQGYNRSLTVGLMRLLLVLHEEARNRPNRKIQTLQSVSILAATCENSDLDPFCRGCDKFLTKQWRKLHNCERCYAKISCRACGLYLSSQRERNARYCQTCQRHLCRECDRYLEHEDDHEIGLCQVCQSSFCGECGKYLRNRQERES